MAFLPCEKCGGKRLKKESLSVKVNGLNISELSSLNIKKAFNFLNEFECPGYKKLIADKIIKEIKKRLQFLLNVGLDYISLDRKALTLSGGEAQRIRLATMDRDRADRCVICA